MTRHESNHHGWGGPCDTCEPCPYHGDACPKQREAAHREPDSGTCWFCRRKVPWATLIAGYDTWDEQRLACATCDRSVRWLRDHGWNLSRADKTCHD